MMPHKANTYTPAETLALIHEVQNAAPGNHEAIEKLLAANTGLVARIAGMYARTRPDSYDDYFQMGQMGFIEAVRKFNPAKGGVLSTYATWYIRQNIQRYFLQDTIIRSPEYISTRHQKIHRAATQLLNDGHEATPARIAAMTGINEEQQERIRLAGATPLYLSSVIQREHNTGEMQIESTLASASNVIEGDPFEADFLREAVMQLCERDRLVITYQFLSPDKLTLDEVALLLPPVVMDDGSVRYLSRERVRQIGQHAVSHLRQIIGATRQAMHARMEDAAINEKKGA